MSGPFLRPMGPLGGLLGQQLRPGEEASVLSEPHKLGTEIDADLFRMNEESRIQRIDRVHLDPGTLTER